MQTARDQHQQRDPHNNPVNREYGKSAATNPAHEPCDHGERDHERNNKADCEDDPLMMAND